MKVTETVDLLANGPFPASAEWRKACVDVEDAIKVTDWPHGSGTFTIHPQSGKKRGQGNGVLPIKIPCVKRLQSLGWSKEGLPRERQYAVTTGDLDALIKTSGGWVGFEWETGNISSSHRALNKLLLALMRGDLVGGFLVVPSDSLKEYLTDRIGNIGELRPYFPLWASVPVANGALRIVVVEQDATSLSVPKIPKMTAGRALQ